MTGWLRGRFRGTRAPQVLFEQMWEDPALELAVFPPGARIFAIASAGCTARALSAYGCRVTAVYINPAQLAYARSRGPVQDGAADRGLAYLRRLAPLAGWTASRLNPFLDLVDPAQQLDHWRQHLNTARFRCTLDALLQTRTLARFYDSALLAQLPGNFGQVLRHRLERGFALHPNRTNPSSGTWRMRSPSSPKRRPTRSMASRFRTFSMAQRKPTPTNSTPPWRGLPLQARASSSAASPNLRRPWRRRTAPSSGAESPHSH
ncbi:MAG: hypothetical protein NTV52_27305 [Acidobacteria bacterium]|nr:hypothetical protein [Acidobacteriota bacterium]